ncbi:MAG: hypothetical protein LBD86_07270, partial [Spirochaetaceae bacterium]|nr:hypothetical protein [Spirochaetaceae bacterium]
GLENIVVADIDRVVGFVQVEGIHRLSLWLSIHPESDFSIQRLKPPPPGSANEQALPRRGAGAAGRLDKKQKGNYDSIYNTKTIVIVLFDFLFGRKIILRRNL